MANATLLDTLKQRLQDVERGIRTFSEYKQMKVSYSQFDEWLDSTQPTVSVMGYAFKPSEVLFNRNYEGYIDSMNKWAESLPLESFEEYQQLLDEREQLQQWILEATR